MADLADKIDDLICVFDGTVDVTLDTMAMYAFGAFALILLVFVLVYHIYSKYKNQKNQQPKQTAEKAQTVSSQDSGRVGKEHHKNGGASLVGGNKPALAGSTPLARKRLASKPSKMGGMVLTKQKSFNTSLPPSATGPEPVSVKWVNDILFWLYSDEAASEQLANLWINTLNEFTRDSVSEHGVGVELVRLLPETHRPILNNIFCECASNDDVTVTCDFEATPAMQVKALRQRGDKVEVSHYRVNVSKLRGRLNVFCITEKLQGEAKFDGWPEVKVLLAPVGSLKNNDLDEQSLQDVIGEIITAAVRSSKVKFNLNQFRSCPRFQRRPLTPSNLLPLHYDSMAFAANNASTFKVGNRLLVKVVKANNLSKIGRRLQPYCVITVDNPSQTFQTVAIENSNNNNIAAADSFIWNEHFLFNTNARSKQITFEVYSKSDVEGEKDVFLGVANVSVEELMEHTFQRQVISLQPRPQQNDTVSGTLTLEFTFVETAVNNNKPNENQSSVGYGSLRQNNPQQNATDYITGGVVPDIMMKDVEYGRKSNNGYYTSTTTTTAAVNPTLNKSTLIIHSVQKGGVAEKGRDPSPRKLQNQNLYNNQQKEQGNAAHSQVQQQDSRDSQNVLNDETDRSRSRRKRDFFGTIRRRLNKSKGRSKSFDSKNYNGIQDSENEVTGGGGGGGGVPNCNSPSGRSISVDRARDHSTHSGHSTIGPLPREGSARSSLSEMSGISGASSRTYINEASTLVLETTAEDGNKKYYLVPLSMAQKTRWRRKGTKLHIYNDHTFVAKHLPGGTACQVCGRTLPRRLGKQGYECRDCFFKCHKQCHVRTDTTCPNSAVQHMDLNGKLKSLKLNSK